MPLRLAVERKSAARSKRVNCVDLHPTEPWMMFSLYAGSVYIWNNETSAIVRYFEVCDLPVRAAKFVPRKNWIVTGSDDMQINVYDYITSKHVHSFEAHDYPIRSIAVHPTQPFILSSSDDMFIKLWNWEKSWIEQQIYEGHTDHVVQIVFNPKNNNTFASASLDKTVKLWQLESPTTNFTLEGHEEGVTCVDYYHGEDKPYLISGAEDRYMKIWDYQNKTCIQTLDSRTQNISAVCFHPELPIILVGSVDGKVKILYSKTYTLAYSLDYDFKKVWSLACIRGSNNVAVGYEEGSITVKLYCKPHVVKFDRENPVFSMDSVRGKIIWAKHREIQQVNLKAIVIESPDGKCILLPIENMGACEIYPQTIQHNSNGRFLAICGEGEYIIYESMALKKKAHGQALEFVWAAKASRYAVRENDTTVTVFKKFKKIKCFNPYFGVNGIFGGVLLGISSDFGFSFYDWNTLKMILRVDMQPTHIYWNKETQSVALVTSDQYFILKYHLKNEKEAGKEGNKEDIENTFQIVVEVNEVVKTALWDSDRFIYTNNENRLDCFVNGKVITIAHFDRPMYLLGFFRDNLRFYLCDTELSVVSYPSITSMLDYHSAIMTEDYEKAAKLIQSVPNVYRTRLAHFLEKKGLKKQALAMSTDPEHRFALALALGDLATAHPLAKKAGSPEKWRQLASLATQKKELWLALKCLYQAHMLDGLLSLVSNTRNSNIRKLGSNGVEVRTNNFWFLFNFILGNLEKCLNILVQTGRISEAAFFARTYAPSKVSAIIKLWKTKLLPDSEKADQNLTDSEQCEDHDSKDRIKLKVYEYVQRIKIKDLKKKLKAKVNIILVPFKFFQQNLSPYKILRYCEPGLVPESIRRQMKRRIIKSNFGPPLPRFQRMTKLIKR